ncbi:MAG: beta galactosidase jelly roll domain-containing protein [Sphingobacteriia bacterium]|nr:beta galactosidase jelly roll domain-containing protein [Sphingobacteriia bacterium]
MFTKTFVKLLITLVVICCCFNCYAEVRLPKLIRDSMVLQRDTPVKLWGWAKANERIRITFNNKMYSTNADINGRWKVVLPETKAGGPYNIIIAGTNTIKLKDILFGDVWICSGQSNMVHQMELHSVRYANDIATANYPQIRHFWIPPLTDLQQPHDDLPIGYWKTATPENILHFSAVAYFFAQQVYEKYKIPIGLINASVGGTPIEAWISEEGFNNFTDIQNIINKNKDTTYLNSLQTIPEAVNTFKPSQEDKGLTEKWYHNSYLPKNWHNISVPGYWEDQGIKDLDGIVWYRKTITIPPSFSQDLVKLFLGRIIDADQVYINGKLIGNTSYQYPQRRYSVPPGILHEGENNIVVRIQNNSGKGGFVPDKPYYLFSSKDTIDLKGDWQYKVGQVFTPQKQPGSGKPLPQNQPTALYNAMIAPIVSYSCKGFLWYQGEANTVHALEYERLMRALINDWRNKWQNPLAPFLYVQLPGYMDMNYLPSESQWAALRNAQLKTLSVSNTGMAITIDLGEWNDIHPDRKKEVGQRLALLAEKIVYGQQSIICSGPLYDTAIIEGNKIIISFKYSGSGLGTTDGEPLNYFSIAGTDKKFVWAKARIENNKIIVWSESVSDPLYVRYAWADNPDGANLCNKEGLPASPFTTEK